VPTNKELEFPMKALRRLHAINLAALTLVSLLATGCLTVSGKTPEARNADAVRIRDGQLAKLYQRHPEAQEVIESSPGYLFTSGGFIHPGFFTFASGWGLAQDNTTGELSYLKYFRFGLGPGLALKGNCSVLVFDSPEQLARVRKSGGANGGVIDASFKLWGRGGSATATTTPKGMEAVYAWTHTGVALEAFWVFTRHKPKEAL